MSKLSQQYRNQKKSETTASRSGSSEGRTTTKAASPRVVKESFTTEDLYKKTVIRLKQLKDRLKRSEANKDSTSGPRIKKEIAQVEKFQKELAKKIAARKAKKAAAKPASGKLTKDQSRDVTQWLLNESKGLIATEEEVEELDKRKAAAKKAKDMDTFKKLDALHDQIIEHTKEVETEVKKLAAAGKDFKKITTKDLPAAIRKAPKVATTRTGVKPRDIGLPSAERRLTKDEHREVTQWVLNESKGLIAPEKDMDILDAKIKEARKAKDSDAVKELNAKRTRIMKQVDSVINEVKDYVASGGDLKTFNRRKLSPANKVTIRAEDKNSAAKPAAKPAAKKPAAGEGNQRYTKRGVTQMLKQLREAQEKGRKDSAAYKTRDADIKRLAKVLKTLSSMDDVVSSASDQYRISVIAASLGDGGNLTTTASPNTKLTAIAASTREVTQAISKVLKMKIKPGTTPKLIANKYPISEKALKSLGNKLLKDGPFEKQMKELMLKDSDTEYSIYLSYVVDNQYDDEDEDEEDEVMISIDQDGDIHTT